MLRRLAIVSVALMVLMAAPALAAPEAPTGTIVMNGVDSLAAAAVPTYGSSVHFATTVNGKVSKQARVYVTVVCLGDSNNVVYQWSKWNDSGDYTFDLVDQAGQGLEWLGGDAYCEAWLIHRVKKGRGDEITYMDNVGFSVDG